MRRLLLVSCFFLIPCISHAYVPNFVNPARSSNYQVVPADGTLHTYYGVLRSFPHMYTVTVSAPSILQVQILVPNDPAIKPDRSGLIVKRAKRGVTEVARLPYKNASWSPQYDPLTHDSYRVGGSYRGTTSPGVYDIEVSTAINQGPYVVQIGVGTNTDPVLKEPSRSYGQQLQDIWRIKRFLHDPWWTVFVTWQYLILLMLGILGVVSVVYWKHRHKYA